MYLLSVCLLCSCVCLRQSLSYAHVKRSIQAASVAVGFVCATAHFFLFHESEKHLREKSHFDQHLASTILEVEAA